MTPVNLIPYDSIKVPENRFRKKFPEEADAALADSIRRIGLLHPPTVEQDGTSFVLRAGERRLRILKKLLGEGHTLRIGEQEFAGGLIPVVDFKSLTPLQRLEVEVEETVCRLDFDFKERAAALTALHELRTAQNPAQTAADTATEAFGRPASVEVNDALIITKHANDPDVSKAKNAKEALAIIRKKAEAIHQLRLSKAVDVSKIKHSLLKGDALEILPNLPEKSFDVILTDPIYGVGADNFGTQSATGHNYEDSPREWERQFQVIPDLLARVAKDRAHCYLFCDPRRFERLTALMVLANWTVFPTPLIWIKGDGMLPFPFHGPRRTYETILYAYRGDRKTLVVKPDVIKVSPVSQLRQAAQKPVALYCDLLSRSASPGDTVLDWAGGSGTILPASNIKKLTATYIEALDEPFNIALTRANTMEIDDGGKADDGLRIDLGDAR